MKKFFKFTILSILFLFTAPFGYSSKLIYKTTKSSLLYDIFAQFFALVPGIIGTFVRASFYKQTLKKSYLDLDIGFCSFFSKIETEVGRGVLITGHTQIGFAHIGDYAVIANYVSILSGRYQHNFTDPTKKITDEINDIYNCISIGAHSFIGDNSTVMASIGDHTIVGAASNVIKPLPPYTVAVGNPAKIVKHRIRNQQSPLYKKKRTVQNSDINSNI